jgi:serine protease AprX
MPRGSRTLALAAALTASLAVAALGGEPALADAGRPAKATAADAGTVVPAQYILRLTPPAQDPQATARVGAVVRKHGGRLVSAQKTLSTAVVAVDAAGAAELARTRGVVTMSPDRVAQPQSLGFDPITQAGSMTNVTRVSGAKTAWTKGYTGAGVDVAVIDTGVAPVSALKASDKVVVGPDLSFESQDNDLRYLDTFGHGTHMSSIIGGREVARSNGSTYANDKTNFYGMAPDSRIVSVKVGDHSGSVDVSQLIAGIDWVVQNRKSGGLNIKVLNLSFGTDSSQPYNTDPLAYAAETAVNNGIFVVASVGNDGKNTSGLADPAYDRFVFAVGAVDTRGTDFTLDDAVPSFSQHPNSTFMSREPDVVAPGVKIVGAGAPGSFIYGQYPAARVGNGFLRGSGTSQAAAVASGAAALLYQKWPNLTPLQVKDLLKRTATPLILISSALQGSGELNVARAIADSPTSSLILIAQDASNAWNTGVTAYLPSTGTGSLEAARGSQHVSLDGVALTGEKDIMGTAWNGAATGNLTKSLGMWDLSSGLFNGTRWAGTGFTADSTTWAGRTWAGRTWAGTTWSGRTWAGGTWSGRTWADAVWNSYGWTGVRDDPADGGAFSGRTWSSSSWTP